ncbi:hypothetical protein [Lacinutrix himadriensis]|uniref:hypothetical protein n=1 Tax=Lacinutrix himadriensis TaxID=641549 RepID=UPI0006E1E831|nr:hypothetical protein [Lacinutrix himadriensis]
MKSRIHLFLLVILCALQFSCKDSSNALIGEWLRHDFKANSEYKLTFEENNTGYIVDQQTTGQGVISNIISIDWKVNKDKLTITQNDKDIVTTFEFTSNGNLLLVDFSAFDFIKQ